MVYVDSPAWPYGRMTMCHMLADSIEELHGMADKLGLLRTWFQDGSIPHYDICKSKRALAIQFGAVEINRHQTAAIMRAWRVRLAQKKPDKSSGHAEE